LLLDKAGRPDEANAVLSEVLTRLERAPKYVCRACRPNGSRLPKRRCAVEALLCAVMPGRVSGIHACL
jgi:hypothetical protein